MAAAAQELARWLASHSFDDIPTDVVTTTKSCIADTMGVALAGAATPWVKAAAAAALAEGRDGGPSHILGTGETTSPALAAMANGTSGHALDFDDDNAQVHAGAAVVATAFALGEATGAPGTALINAVLLGYETAIRVGWALDPDAMYARGFHPTGIANAFGCAATAGVLLDLPEDQLAHTLGIVGSMAAGLLEFYSDGAMTKRLHAGHPAYCGVMAARLASQGFTGPATVFEGPRGAITAYSGTGSPEPLTRGLGQEYMILATAQKLYPMNFATHGAIDLVGELMRKEDLTADDVAHVRVWVRPFVAGAIGGPQATRPTTVLGAQMSMPFAVAITMLEGRVTLDHLSAEWIDDPRVHRHAANVETLASPELDEIDGIEDGSVLPTVVEMTTTDGRTFEGELHYQRGEPRNPLTSDDLEEKFLACAGRVLGSDRARAALDELERIEQWTEATTFMRMTRI